MVILIVVICSVSIRYSGGQKGSENDYAPGDTRIVSYNPAFCQSLTLKDTSPTGATLYLLKEKPALTGHDNFTITRQYTLSTKYEYLYYYLYPGSNISGTMYLISGATSKFYLIKGTKNFDRWSDDRRSSHALEYFDINSNRTFVYSVTSEDQYYLVFYNPRYTTSSVVGATLMFNRALYQITNQNDIVHSCKAGGSPSTCTLDIPFQSSYTALIIVDSPTVDIDENISIDTSCGSRVWMYVVITVLPVLFVVLCVVGTVVTCVLVKRHRQKKYEPLNDPPTATAHVGTGGVVTEPAPPPFNPDYGASTLSSEPPPAYSSVVKH